MACRHQRNIRLKWAWNERLILDIRHSENGIGVDLVGFNVPLDIVDHFRNCRHCLADGTSKSRIKYNTIKMQHNNLRQRSQKLSIINLHGH